MGIAIAWMVMGWLVGCLHDALGYDDVSYGRCFLSYASNQCGVMLACELP